MANTYRVNWAKQDLIIQSPLSKGEFGHLLALSGSTQDQAGRVIAIFHPPASLPDSYGHWTNFFEKVKRETPDALAHVGYTMFETDRIAPTWVEACKSVDEIWVPTEFNRRTFTGSGVDPSSIHVIPLGIDASKYEGAEPARLSDAAGFNFLSVFEWSKRKGYDLLLRAYAESFTRDDDVALFIRTYRYPASGSAQPDFSQLFERFCPDPVRAPKVVLLLNDLDDQAMASLYAACQAFVLPSRGEGWGIPYMEAMVSGLPTIGTRWSGNLEFMNDDNSFLIDIEGLTEIPNGDPEYPDVYWGHRMAAPSLEHLKRLMRFVYEHPAEAQQRGKQARRDMATLWTKENVAHKVTERLTELAVRGQAARQPPDKGIGHRSAASSLLRRSAPICGSRADPPPNHRPLRWAGPAFQSGDYGCELRDLAGALSSWPGVVRLEDLAWGLEQTLPRPTQFKLLLELMDQSIAEDADWIRVWHCPPTFFRVEEGANVSIGRASCETDSLPEDWLASCDRVDQLWLPSQFHVDCFAQAGVSRDKLRILPECIDSEQYGPGVTPASVTSGRGFNFMSILDTGSAGGGDSLLRAWAREFTGEDDVALVLLLKLQEGETEQQVAGRIQQLLEAEHLGRSIAPICIMRWPGEAALPGFYRAANAYVHPNRSAGWNRRALEAMASELPVISSRWAARADLLTDSNSFAVQWRTLEAPPGAAQFFASSSSWAELEVDDLGRALREAAMDPAATHLRGCRARADIIAKHGVARISEILGGLIEEAIAQRKQPVARCA